MTDEAPPKDSDLIPTDLIKVLVSYHGAMGALCSCMISVAAGLRQSPNDAERAKGEEAWERLEKVISSLEEASGAMSVLMKSIGAADES